MNGIMQAINSGVQNKEIVNLWYEVTYLRFLLIHVLENNPDIGNCVTEESLHKSKELAQEVVLKRFPGLGVTFPEETPKNSTEIKDEKLPY